MHDAKINAAFNVTGLMCRLLFIDIGFLKINILMGTWFVLQPFLQKSFHKLAPA